MNTRVLLVMLVMLAGGCQRNSDAPPKAQAGTLTEAPLASAASQQPPATAAAADSTSAATPAPAPLSSPAPAEPAARPAAPKKAPKKAPEKVAAKAPEQATVTRDAAETKAPPMPVPPPPPPATAATPAASPIAPPDPPAAPPPPKLGYSGPMTGTLRWFGTVEPNEVITIEGERSSIGTMTGALPGVRVLVQLVSKDLVIVESPAPANAWRRLRVRSLVRQTALTIQWTVLP